MMKIKIFITDTYRIISHVIVLLRIVSDAELIIFLRRELLFSSALDNVRAVELALLRRVLKLTHSFTVQV